MHSMTNLPESTRRYDAMGHLRYLISRADAPDSTMVGPIAEEVDDAIIQTVQVFGWLNDLQRDGYENYRGGTEEKKDVPFPQPPEGHLVNHILGRLGLTSAVD